MDAAGHSVCGEISALRRDGSIVRGLSVGALWLVSAAGSTCAGQGPATPATAASAAGAQTLHAEAPIDGVVRRDADSVVVRLARGTGTSAAADLVLHGFMFNGDPVLTNKLHLKQLAPGVIEITSLAYSLGDWEFSVTDRADIYGLGEHFDTLNHAHTVVRNASQDNGGTKGTSTYKPMPFLHEYERVRAVGGYDGRGDVRLQHDAPERHQSHGADGAISAGVVYDAGVSEDSGGVYEADAAGGGAAVLGVCAMDGAGLRSE